MKIVISIINEAGEMIAHRDTSSWEVAEMNLESLKNWYKKEQEELERLHKEDEMNPQ